MGNIISVFILREIFSFLKKRIVLKIIKYNKYLQKEIEINNIILDYMRLTGRYIIYEGKGKRKGKEYDILTNKLSYEGEFLNGKRNGTGKEYYYNGQLKYIGEYLNGERNGKGEEFDIKGQLIYIGEYLEGDKIISKSYGENGNITYGVKLKKNSKL